MGSYISSILYPKVPQIRFPEAGCCLVKVNIAGKKIVEMISCDSYVLTYGKKMPSGPMDILLIYKDELANAKNE